MNSSLNATSHLAIRRQDARSVLTGIAKNPIGQAMVFDFVVDRWEEMVQA